MEAACWCTIQYYELNQRVGPPFKPTSKQVYINGYTHTLQGDHLCLGSLSNPTHNDKTESTRKHIGDGIMLTYACGDLFVDCLSDYAVFFWSDTIIMEMKASPTLVIKLLPRGSSKVFSNLEFSKALHDAVPLGYNATYALNKVATVQLSFIKGWGPDYHRQSVNCTPCWLEIQMHGPLMWLDKVLVELGPTTFITSKS
eukprot:Em0015g1302a